MRRSSFSKSANPISCFSGGCAAAASAAGDTDPLGLFLDERDSWDTSPLDAGFTLAASTIASTCSGIMRVARYSYFPMDTFSRAF